MKKNLLTLKTQFETYKVSLELDTYLDSKRIAILLIGWEKNESYPVATLTVNIPDENISGINCNFVDDNNLPFICSFIEKYKLGEPTHNLAFSGYCVYPEYKFNLDEIKKYII